MDAKSVICLAETHLGGVMQTSALMCLKDADLLFAAGEHEAAKRRALDSLRFSVGVFHPAYKRAASN